MLQLLMLDVGQGESLILDFPDDSFGVVDAGPRSKPSEVAALPHIQSRLTNGFRFRFLALSQWDRDHVAGAPAILDRTKPEQIVIPGGSTELIEKLIDKANDKDLVSCYDVVSGNSESMICPVFAPYKLAGGDKWSVDIVSPFGTMLQEIAHDIDRKTSAQMMRRWRNRISLCFAVSAYDRLLFLPGEVDGDQFRAIAAFFRRDAFMSHVPMQADWIKLSHHGADLNNPPELFQQFAKSRFVASASAGARYGHPHPAALKRLAFDMKGGRAMCTQLGQGCHAMIQNSVNGRSVLQWDQIGSVSSMPSPGKTCYGNITVSLTPSACRVQGDTSQPSCPFRGPKRRSVQL